MSDTAEYSKGYAAGRRRAKHDDQMHERYLARMTLAGAIAPAVQERPWTRTQGAKVTQLNDAKGIAEVVALIVKEIERLL